MTGIGLNGDAGERLRDKLQKRHKIQIGGEGGWKEGSLLPKERQAKGQIEGSRSRCAKGQSADRGRGRVEKNQKLAFQYWELRWRVEKWI